MRTTGKINNNNSLMYINRNFQTLSKVTSQVAMQQQVIDLDDNPLAANVGIRMLNMIAKSDQYNSNVKTGIGMLGLTGQHVMRAKTTVQGINDVLITAANATSADARSAQAVEINDALKSLLSMGNAHDGTRYLFGGTNTTKPPFTMVNGRYVHYTGNDNPINLLVDNGTYLPANATGSDAFGNMTTAIKSKDMNPRVNLTTDHATPLSELNSGGGVPKGKIIVKYSAFPDGLEVDLGGCDTLEDVKDKIEQTTMDASRNLDPGRNPWLNGESMDWHDLQDRYVKVTMNPDGSGISLQERDLGEPLPPPSAAEQRRGLAYSGNPGYAVGGGGIAAQGAPMPDGGYTTHDKLDYVNFPAGNMYTTPLRVDDYALNKVAEGLGIKGMAGQYDPSRPDAANAGFLHGRDLDPGIWEGTLLSDLEGYNDGVYSITNGGKPGSVAITESSQDGGVFNDWNLSGLSKGDNTGAEGELYARAVNAGTVDKPEIRIEIYTRSGSGRKSDLVATGVYDEKAGGGTVILEEANNSGLSGTVGLVFPPSLKEATVDLKVDFQDSLQASVHVPAFEEEQYENGRSKDVLNIASGWNIQGLDKPPAAGYDENHPISTDLDGNVSVNYRYDETTNSMIVELSRPASGNTPAAVIATGSIALGAGNTPPDMAKAVSGRVELVGAPGFEQVSGSVYLELPKGLNFTGAGSTVGTGADNRTSNTYPLQGSAPAGTIVLGGATEFAGDLPMDPEAVMVLREATVFKKGQAFLNDVILPGGGYIKAGTPLASDTVIPKGAEVRAETILAGTVFPAGQQIATGGEIPSGTIIPQGSYYVEPADAGFPAVGMGMYTNRMNPVTGEMEQSPVNPPAVAGYNLKATFATVEDLQREIEQAGVYVDVGISDDGRSLEFRSSLAGAWLTVSEDFDAYEQMGDRNQQLANLNLNGLVKGANTDGEGNVHTEVIYYPPDPARPDDPVRLVSEDGEVTEIQPGYYVRVYSDQEQLEKDYEDRDNTTMLAEGFIPAGKWNPDFDPELAATDPDYDVPAFLSSQEAIGTGLFENGLMDNLVLEERNDSGVWGTVDLDYHGDRPDYEITEVRTVENEDGTTETIVDVNYSTDNNARITVYPGGLRPAGTDNVLMQQWDISPVKPGVNSDYSGTFHGSVTADADSAAGVSIRLYKDSSRRVMSARNDPAEAPVDGKVTLYEVDADGKFVTDSGGGRIVLGSVALPNGADNLADGMTDAFEVKTGGLRHGGQQREENVFATINDIIDALNQNDEESLHNLLEDVSRDEDRLLACSGNIEARGVRFELLSERHADDVLNFSDKLTQSVGMDDQALARAIMDYQASTNAYQAAMQVSAQVMQLSLLQYL